MIGYHCNCLDEQLNYQASAHWLISGATMYWICDQWSWHSTLPTPVKIDKLTLPAGAFRCTNVKNSTKVYTCRECNKTSFNWGTLVSDFLRQHLGVQLVCPKCGMSFSDHMNFHHHGKSSITCCLSKLSKIFTYCIYLGLPCTLHFTCLTLNI